MRWRRLGGDTVSRPRCPSRTRTISTLSIGLTTVGERVRTGSRLARFMERSRSRFAGSLARTGLTLRAGLFRGVGPRGGGRAGERRTNIGQMYI